MSDRIKLPAAAIRKADESSDPRFYVAPRYVTHIDERAVAAVTELYREFFRLGSDLVDVMSSWVSHLPPEVRFGEVVGHGMNAAELAANPRLLRWFVQDLNEEPCLPFASHSVDGSAICVSVQYLQRPIEVMTEVARVLRPRRPGRRHLLEPLLPDQGRGDLEEPAARDSG